MDSETQGTVYLLHFAEPMSHAQHYLGWTNNLDARLRQHKGHKNPQCRITSAFSTKGISFVLARTWAGTIAKEKELKRLRNGRKLCPVCTPQTKKRIT